MSRHSSVVNISLFLGSVVFVLLLSEFIVRLYLPQPGFTPNSFGEPNGLWVNDKTTGFRYAGNYSGQFSRDDFDVSIFTDGLGNRIDSKNRGVKKHGYNIIAVGDSLTFGWGVEVNEAWPYYLATKLNTFQLPRRDIGILNLGVSSFNINQMALRAKQTISLQKPDMLVLGFYVGGMDRISNPYHLIAGNHIREKQLSFIKRYKDGVLFSALRCPELITLDFWLSENFYIGALVWKAVGKYFENLMKCRPAKEEVEKIDWEKKWEQDLSSAVATSLEMSRYLESKNIEFIILLMVTEEPDGTISKRQRNVAAEFEKQLSKSGVNIFNTAQLLGVMNSPKQRFRFENDGHWNKNGHQLIAYELAKYIRAKNLIK